MHLKYCRARYLVNICKIFGQYLQDDWSIFARYMVNICKIFGQYLQDIRPPIKILCWYCLTCYTLIIQCLFQVYKLPKNSSSWSWIQQSWVDKGKSEEEDTVSHISTVTFHVISIKWPRTNKFWMNWVRDISFVNCRWLRYFQGSDFGQTAKEQARRRNDGVVPLGLGGPPFKEGNLG